MNNFDYSFTYRYLDAIDITIHFQFSTDIELLKTWEGGETQYYMRLELEDITGEIYNQSTYDTTYFEGGNASIQLEAEASNNATVYGVYFREFDPDPENLAFSWRVGLDPDTDNPAGYGQVSGGCDRLWAIAFDGNRKLHFEKYRRLQKRERRKPHRPHRPQLPHRLRQRLRQRAFQ